MSSSIRGIRCLASNSSTAFFFSSDMVQPSGLLKLDDNRHALTDVAPSRAASRERLDVAAGGGRGVEKQDAAGFAAGTLPGMRDVAREERAGAGAADGNIVADLKGNLAGEHPGDLVQSTGWEPPSVA